MEFASTNTCATKMNTKWTILNCGTSMVPESTVPCRVGDLDPGFSSRRHHRGITVFRRPTVYSVHSPLYHTDTKPGHSLRIHLVEMTATVGNKPERTLSSVQSFRSDPALFPNVLLQMKKHGCESRFLSDSFLADPDSHDT